MVIPDQLSNNVRSTTSVSNQQPQSQPQPQPNVQPQMQMQMPMQGGSFNPLQMLGGLNLGNIMGSLQSVGGVGGLFGMSIR